MHQRKHCVTADRAIYDTSNSYTVAAMLPWRSEHAARHLTQRRRYVGSFARSKSLTLSVVATLFHFEYYSANPIQPTVLAKSTTSRTVAPLERVETKVKLH